MSNCLTISKSVLVSNMAILTHFQTACWTPWSPRRIAGMAKFPVLGLVSWYCNWEVSVVSPTGFSGFVITSQEVINTLKVILVSTDIDMCFGFD